MHTKLRVFSRTHADKITYIHTLEGLPVGGMGDRKRNRVLNRDRP